MKKAFSLVELSIVLVILGLLTGGILTGQSLIRAAELRKVTSQVDQMSTSAYTFRDKYFALPGDMRNATAFWGEMGDAAAGACPATAGTGTETCNGDGDGLLSTHADANERFTYWQHLANAEMMGGSFTGVQSSGGGSDGTIGVNIPAASISNAGFMITHQSAAAASIFTTGPAHTIILGADIATAQNGSVLTAEDAWNIDTKLDDGRPSFGRVRGFNNTTRGCSTTDDADTAEYALATSDIVCPLVFLPGF